jgi:hypothetical protein
LQTLRGMVRRVTALFPKTYGIYLEICQARGISAEGGQLDLSGCAEFFAKLLGPQG